jgi:hypothetical protein
VFTQIARCGQHFSFSRHRFFGCWLNPPTSPFPFDKVFSSILNAPDGQTAFVSFSDHRHAGTFPRFSVRSSQFSATDSLTNTDSDFEPLICADLQKLEWPQKGAEGSKGFRHDTDFTN